MNNRRAQLRISAIYTAIVAIVVVILTTIAVHGGTDRIRNRTERAITNRLSALVATTDVSSPPSNESDAWLVDTQSQNAKPLAETSLEPPLIGLATDIVANGSQFREFSQEGSPYLLTGQRLPNSQFVVAVAQPLTDEHGETGSLRLRLWLLAIGVILATAVLSWVIAAWALRPARRADQQQRTFLANAAHELRTPLTVIRASASQTLERPRSGEEYVRSLDEIGEAATRASELVGDMLELARLDAGQLSLRRSPLRLDLLAEEVAEVIGRGRVSVGVENNESVIVEADYGLLRQAAENVVRNAAKHATRVTMRVTADARDGVLVVTDDGPGFDAALLPKVFERFHRGDHNSDHDGTGLGLAIVASIVAAHGGAVAAANGARGGAEVTMRIPRSGRGVRPGG